MSQISEGVNRLLQSRYRSKERVRSELSHMIASLDHVLAISTSSSSSSSSSNTTNTTTDLKSALEQARMVTAGACESISTHHRNYHIYISKLQKMIDKRINKNGGSSSDSSQIPFFPSAAHLQEFNQVDDPYMTFIIKYLAWYGEKTAVLSIESASYKLSENEWNHMNTIAPVITSIRNKKYDALYQWLNKLESKQPSNQSTKVNDDDNQKKESSSSNETYRRIRFEIAVLQYLTELEYGSLESALALAQSVFPPFHKYYLQDIGKLMALPLWKSSSLLSSSSSSMMQVDPPLPGVIGNRTRSDTIDSIFTTPTSKPHNNNNNNNNSNNSNNTTSESPPIISSNNINTNTNINSNNSNNSNHPYPHLTVTTQRECLEMLILTASANIYNLSPLEPHLQTVVDVGIGIVEPTLFNSEHDECDFGPYSTKDGIVLYPDEALDPLNTEIPVEVNLPASFRYHSTVTCPVTWQTATSENYPVLLNPCGHVILYETSLNLPKHGGDRFYCPTCYSEVHARDLIEMVI